MHKRRSRSVRGEILWEYICCFLDWDMLQTIDKSSRKVSIERTMTGWTFTGTDQLPPTTTAHIRLPDRVVCIYWQVNDGFVSAAIVIAVLAAAAAAAAALTSPIYSSRGGEVPAGRGVVGSSRLDGTVLERVRISQLNKRRMTIADNKNLVLSRQLMGCKDRPIVSFPLNNIKQYLIGE